MSRLNWNPIVTSFINRIIKEGFTLVGGFDTEDELDSNDPKKVSEFVCQCDEGVIYFEKEGFNFSAVIILGNHPCETVSDWSWNRKTPQRIQDEFESAWSEWSNSWENRECPTEQEVTEQERVVEIIERLNEINENTKTLSSVKGDSIDNNTRQIGGLLSELKHRLHI